MFEAICNCTTQTAATLPGRVSSRSQSVSKWIDKQHHLFLWLLILNELQTMFSAVDQTYQIPTFILIFIYIFKPTNWYNSDILIYKCASKIMPIVMFVHFHEQTFIFKTKTKKTNKHLFDDISQLMYLLLTCTLKKCALHWKFLSDDLK